MESRRRPLRLRPPPACPPAALTARPAAEQADAPLLAALRPLQLALVAVGGGVGAAHRRHHARAGARPAHAGGSARALCVGLAHSAEATQHPSAGWGATGTEGQGPRSAARAPPRPQMEQCTRVLHEAPRDMPVLALRDTCVPAMHLRTLSWAYRVRLTSNPAHRGLAFPHGGAFADWPPYTQPPAGVGISHDCLWGTPTQSR